jgi:lipopolysaccharide export system ATP-binding protein
LDEPFTGIDPRTIDELQEIIRGLTQRGIGVLITDHNVGATLGITDRNYILVQGKIIAAGDREAIVNNPDVRKHYLGERFE